MNESAFHPEAEVDLIDLAPSLTSQSKDSPGRKMSASTVTPEHDGHGGHTSATTTPAAARDHAAVGTADLHSHGPLDQARFAPGHIFASRYRIVSMVGRGAMGDVYRADDLKLGQRVALKLLVVDDDRRGRQPKRFITEVRLARTIAHPNVCHVYDIGEADSVG